jgi:hypothetical protein
VSTLFLCNFEAKNAWSIISTPPYTILAWWLSRADSSFTFKISSSSSSISLSRDRSIVPGWPCQKLKLPPASLSGSWGVLGPLTTSRWQPFERDFRIQEGKPRNKGAHLQLLNKKIYKRGRPIKRRKRHINVRTFSTKPNLILTLVLTYTKLNN